MTYELARQLKDAGYPQPDKGEFFLFISEKHYVQNGKPVYRHAYWKKLYTKATKGWHNDFVYIPTLSELIAACGDGVFNLMRKSEFHRMKDGDVWKATIGAVQNIKSLTIDEIERNIIERGGATPEEAVARLYLSLHPLK